MKYVKQIANTNRQKRRDAILNILSENKINYKLYGQKQNNHFTENIVVSINPKKRRYVIGAHYDNVNESIGAVDNASGVSVMLKLLFALYNNTEKSIDFVFFDREEYEDRGSEAYINSVGKENIIAMLNLDPCGFGDVIAVHKMYNGTEKWLDSLFDDKLTECFPIKKVGFTPNGDHMTFSGNGVPTVEICTVSKALAECFEKISKYAPTENNKSQNSVPQELIDEFLNSYDLTTFHNGKNDKLETVSESIMSTLEKYLIKALV